MNSAAVFCDGMMILRREMWLNRTSNTDRGVNCESGKNELSLPLS